MSENAFSQVIRHKVLLRLAAGPKGFAAELSCRGVVKRYTGAARESPRETACAGLAAALDAMRTPCSVEVYLNEQFEDLLRETISSGRFPHQLQPYFLDSGDDPRLHALAELVGPRESE